MDEDKLSQEAEKLASGFDIDTTKAIGLVEDAAVLILDYTNRDIMIDPLWVYARQLATVAYNQEGNEGESSRSEGGVSQNFIDDIPSNIKHGLNRYRVGKVVSYYAPKET